MLPLAVLIFLVTLAVEVVGWIGKDTLANVVFPLFATGPSAKQTRAYKAEILAAKAELAATSSQDEFAKWAKLRRKLDKSVAELEALTAAAAGTRSAFGTKFKGLLWVLTTVLPFVISSWHRKEAVFFLPQGWFGPATYFLGLPSAPTGAIACGIWTMVCKRFLGVVKGIFVDLLVRDAVPVKVPIAVPASATSERKKEL